MIPLEDLALKETQRDLAEKAFGLAIPWLEEIKLDDYQKNLDLDATNDRKSTGPMFNNVPAALRKTAVDKEQVYVASMHAHRNRNEEIQIRVPSIIYTPTGGLPEWAKSYARLFRRS